MRIIIMPEVSNGPLTHTIPHFTMPGCTFSSKSWLVPQCTFCQWPKCTPTPTDIIRECLWDKTPGVADKKKGWEINPKSHSSCYNFNIYPFIIIIIINLFI